MTAYKWRDDWDESSMRLTSFKHTDVRGSLDPSLFLRPLRAIRVSRRGLEPRRGFVRELTRDIISHPKPPRTTGSEAEGILRLGKILSEKSSVPRKEGLIREGGVKRGFTIFFVLFIDIVLYPLRKTQKSTSSTRWKRLKRCWNHSLMSRLKKLYTIFDHNK